MWAPSPVINGLISSKPKIRLYMGNWGYFTLFLYITSIKNLNGTEGAIELLDTQVLGSIQWVRPLEISWIITIHPPQF